MAEKVLMLALSPTMEEGTVTEWHKKEGDSIAQGEVICQVETDKANMDYESVNEGTLLKILVPEGGSAKVGDPIAIVGKPGEDITGLLEEQKAGEAQAALQAGEAHAPAAAAQPAPSAAPRRPSAPGGPPAPPEQPARAGAATAARTAPAGRVSASPLARRLAAEAELELGSIPGSGPGGRVVKRDVESALKQRPAAAGAAAVPEAARADQRLPISGKRRVIARRMAESKFSAPHYYLKIEVAVDPLLQARARLNAGRPAGEKVSLNAFLLKFCAEALKRHPQVNSSWQGDAILRYARQDLGLAVAQEDGLIAPVVRDCGAKGILQIDRELRALVEKTRSNRLTPEEYAGATFTVSNLGSAGILEFTAIINPPGSAILAVGRISRVPVVEQEEQIRVRSQMILTLSCDHRVVDGAVGAEFLAGLKRLLENPIEVLF